MSGGGSSAPAQPSTTTQIQDIPEWEQGYVTNLLGQAQTIAAQPYQQFQGPQVAGFTPDQTQAFQNIEGAGATNQAYQNSALGQAGIGATSANSIYGAGSPYLQASALAASPQGIQAYMSPYTNDVVNGIQNEANLNWNQNIMPGVNDKFVGAGQYGSGRNAQVLGQAAGNFQTGLSSNIANALQSGYTTAGNQAATEAGLLNSAGTDLGNLASTQTGQQLNAANTIGNIGSQNAATNLNQNTALQAVGQQQQQLNQTNLDTAQQNFQNQVNYPAQQTEYLNQIIRGLPAPAASTSSTQQTPAYSVSPLSGIGGSLASAAGLLGKKEGGLIKGYAEGGSVDDYDPMDEYSNPLDYVSKPAITDLYDGNGNMDEYTAEGGNSSGNNVPPPVVTAGNPLTNNDNAMPNPVVNPLALDKANNSSMPTPPQNMLTPEQMQQNQLLALARGMLTPSLGGSTAAAFGQGLGNMQEVQMKQQEQMMNQNNLNYQRQMDAKKLGIEQQRADQMDQYHKDVIAAKSPYEFRKDAMGNTVAYDKQTGLPVNGGNTAASAASSNLSGDDYLKTIPSLRAANAKAASEGRLAITPFLLKTPYGQQLLSDTMQYDPTYDAAAAPARVATRKDFTAGASSKNITSLNTALGHAAGWMDSAAALNNGNHDWLNYAENTAKSADSYPQLKAFNDKADALADELTRTFRGTGGSVTEVQNWRKNLSPNMSPDEQKASVAALSDLLDSRLDALGATYTRGMNKSVDPTSFLTPKGLAAYNKIHGVTSASNAPSNDVAPSAAPAQPDLLSAIAAERAKRKGLQ